MAQRVFQQVINHGPSVAAAHTYIMKMPFDCQLIHVSTCNSTATVITLKIGNTSDDDGYLLALNCGVSGAPVEVATHAGFAGVLAGGQFPHMAKGELVQLTFSNAAVANLFVVLTFTEG